MIPALLALGACSGQEARGEPGHDIRTTSSDHHDHHGHLPGPVEAAKSSEYTLIDVRTPAEFTAGHLAKAQNIDVQDPTFDDKAAQIPKDGHYVVYCKSGTRSGIAKARLDGAGFTSVVDGGGMNELLNAGVPKA